MIHEVTHAVGIRGSQRAEMIAEIRALKHRNPNPSFGDIRSIVTWAKKMYSELAYRVTKPGTGNH
jgi:hypothetical protein